MNILIILIVLSGVAFLCGLLYMRFQDIARKRELDDALYEARRWVERLAGQVGHLLGTNAPAKQAVADASERFTGACSLLDLAKTVDEAALVKETAMEGLHYLRAARMAMSLNPGPALPDEAERSRAGAVSEHRRVEVDGECYEASPQPGPGRVHYHPGGDVAGRPVPRGWYSLPWWKSASDSGVWDAETAVLFGALLEGMAGIADLETWANGNPSGGRFRPPAGRHAGPARP
ncbi:hypothetical protein [Amycolatopsis keratiniphila]|uniref:hypothetical protein n=1 Tax=Amycolatopsis keratiniphila TaxID=129921 RepID=UPI00087B909D|nr:hypothetical protein [Amycolatopsis keratiniphila]OLZ49921.1 hypothetical protein BS330_31895 [Amycolatopsis keratiniphila subsp. nogabecina]SDU25986.1 hypothetical protein SAMN04489733_2491 [Amycolatopsis keratiniphila]